MVVITKIVCCLRFCSNSKIRELYTILCKLQKSLVLHGFVTFIKILDRIGVNGCYYKSRAQCTILCKFQKLQYFNAVFINYTV